jgi:hypothetical protein
MEASLAITIHAARNNLGTSKSRYYALASSSRSVSCDQLVDRMAAGRTTFSKAEILGVFQLAREELVGLLAEGCYVNTPFGAVMPLASGTLSSPSEAFRPGAEGLDHRLRFDFRIDPKLEKAALAKLKCKRAPNEDITSPRIESVVSLQSGKSGEASAGGLVSLSGFRLKVSPQNEEQGLFLRSASGLERRCAVYGENRPRRLVALVPADVAPGKYVLVVRAATRKGRPIEGAWPEAVRVIKG